METQTQLYGHEVELGYFPKKDCVTEPRQIEIKAINKAEYGFSLILYAGFCGDRQMYINNTQYVYLKNNNATKCWVKATENGLNKKKKMEYSAKVSCDQIVWI